MNNSKKWPGIMKIEEIIHYDTNNNIKYKDSNIFNILHAEGEDRILRALFTGGPSNNTFIPTNYFLGLDNRGTLSEDQTLSSLIGEPAGFGYARQPLSSLTGFNIIVSSTSVQARSNVVLFSSTTNSWGPVKNLFLTNVSTGTSGQLYSTAPLNSSVIVAPGESISVRFAMSLKNC